MHSQLALTEHASLNLAPLILLDSVHVVGRKLRISWTLCRSRDELATWWRLAVRNSVCDRTMH